MLYCHVVVGPPIECGPPFENDNRPYFEVFGLHFKVLEPLRGDK